MRDFGSIVFVPLRGVNDRRHHDGVGRRVTAQLVRDQTPWRTALSLQELPEEAFGCMPIAPGLEEDVDYVAVLVDGPPEILLAPLDMYEQFVQVPRVAQASLPAPEDPSVRRTELPTPLRIAS